MLLAKTHKQVFGHAPVYLPNTHACNYHNTRQCSRPFLFLAFSGFVRFYRSLRQYDFTSARVALVPSVPGTRPKHKGADLYKYGHMRVRGLLETEPRLLKDEHHHKVAFQFSSLASLTKDPVRSTSHLLLRGISE